MKRRRLPASRNLRLHSRSQRRIDHLRYQGIAVALAELARAHMEADLALMVLKSLGLSVVNLKNAGADAYDLETPQDAQAQER
jgi:hypothetical protein